MSGNQSKYSEAEIRKGWRVYKLVNWIIDRVDADETKCVRDVWYGRREKDDFTIFLAFPAKKEAPLYAAVRIDYKGTTVLDSIHNEKRHEVLTFEPGNWERLISRVFRTGCGDV